MRYFLLLLVAACFGCGESGRDSFAGTWNGNLPLLANGCSFTPPNNQDQVFPIVVNDLPDNEVQVIAATGKSGAGATLEYSFNISTQLIEPIAEGQTFSGCKVTYSFGLFAAYEDSKAQSELQVVYSECENSDSNCTILYSGVANLIR